jgi:ABC-2 type transport system permease protein
MSKLSKIIRMEFRLTASNKLFIVLTILGPFLIAAVTVLPGTLANSGSRMGSPETRIAIAGPDQGFIDAISPALALSKIQLVPAQDTIASLDAEVLAGAFDGYIVLPPDLTRADRLEYVSKSAGDIRMLSVLQGVIGQAIVVERLVKAGISAVEVASLTQPPAVESRQLTRTGEKKSTDFLTVLMTGLVLAMLLYMTVLLYGQVIGRSVLSEKTSKTAEIMLSSVRPMDLLFGKILGKAAASLLQYGIWVGVTTVFLKLFGPLLGVPLSLRIGLPTLLFLVLFFLLAFFLYCSLYAALGAASEDEQHLGQLAWPMILFLVLPVVLIFPIISTPQAPLVVGLSFFPLTAPIVMFLRILVGAAKTWEVLLSVGLLLASIAGVIVLSAKIFRVGLLMTGKRFKVSEIWRLAAWK